MPVSFVAALLLAQASTPALEQLPERSRDPLAIARAADPVIALSRTTVPLPEFTALVQGVVARSPAVDEGKAGIAEAQAARAEARSGLRPIVDVGINAQQSFDREFSNDPDNIVERTRARGRTDLTVSVTQVLFDFGAAANRVAGAGARLRAAASQAEAEADRVALRAIAAWYDVFAYRALVSLGGAFTENQQDLRSAIETRIASGVSAPGDLPRVESYIASAQADLARYRRQLANAEARFEELYGVPAPAGIGRAPVIERPSTTKEAAQFLARSSPEVESAEAIARAAHRDARADRSSTFPSLGGAVDAGKYGIDRSDYDVRGRLILRHRIFGPGDARADQSEARADAADARAARVRDEAEREAAIAWTDVRALEAQLAALETSYISSRQSRDVLAERFRVARGTLFDLLETESSYFSVAASYIRAITELDASRYVLLSRTGQLLSALDIAPPAPEAK